MRLELLEQLSLPGDTARLSEDASGFSERAALVLDGATPLGPPLLPGTSDAAWIAQFGARRLMAHLKDGDAARDALAHALADAERSFAGLARHPVRESWQTPCAAMMLAVLDAAGSGLDCFWFADCTALLQQGGAVTVIGEGFRQRGAEARRARMLSEARGLAPAPDFNRPQLLDALKASRSRINSGSRWLFSPQPRAAEHVSYRNVPAAAGDRLLLGTDGFFALASDYAAYTPETLFAAARDKGLAALGTQLRALEESDPLGARFPRFKKSDDATALLLQLL